MTKRNRIHIYLIVVCLIITPFIFLSCQEKEVKTTETPDNLLFAVVNDSGPKSDRFQALVYMAIDGRNGELLVIVTPEDTRIEMPGIGFNRIKHAYFFEDLSLTSKSIAKYMGLSERTGHHIAIDKETFISVLNDMKSISLGRDAGSIKASAAVEEFLEGVKQKKPEVYRVIIAGFLEKLIEHQDISKVIPYRDGKKQKSLGTNLNKEAYKNTIDSISLLDEVTVVVLPGSARKDQDIYYWDPYVGTLSGFRKIVAGDGLASGIRYLAEQRLLAANRPTTITQETSIAVETTGAVSLNSAETTLSVEETQTREFTVDVLNGGRVQGSALRISVLLKSKGFSVGEVGNYTKGSYAGSTIYYAPGWEREAKKVADSLEVETIKPFSSSLGVTTKAQVLLIIGRDIR